MEEVGVREFKARASELLRRVRDEHVSYAITYRGRVIAHLEPADKEERRARSRAILAEMKEIAEEIGRSLPPETSAVEAVREQRRR